MISKVEILGSSPRMTSLGEKLRMQIKYKSLGTGKNIVLIHGWGMHSVVWNSVAKKLSKLYRVTWFDLPGYGENENSISDVYKIIPPQSIVIGWSMGGLIASRLGMDYPELVSRLILVACNPCFVQKPNWPGMQEQIFDQFKMGLNKNPDKALNRFLSLQGLSVTQLRNIRKVMHLKLDSYKECLMQGIKLLRSVDLRLELGKIKVPMLFILGEKDQIVPVAISEHLSTDAKIKIIDNAGHMPFVSHEEVFLKTVQGFIDA